MSPEQLEDQIAQVVWDQSSALVGIRERSGDLEAFRTALRKQLELLYDYAANHQAEPMTKGVVQS